MALTTKERLRDYQIAHESVARDNERLEAEIARLQAELENERAHNKRLLAQLENWDLIEINGENNRLRAALEVVQEYLRTGKWTQLDGVDNFISKALANEQKD